MKQIALKMLRNVLKSYNKRTFETIRQFSGQSQIVDTKKNEIFDTRLISSDDGVHYNQELESSVLEKCQEDISHVAPYLKPSFNFAAYINKSETLQELIKLGVNLHKLEKQQEVPPYILQLDFEKNIKNNVIFLSDLGLNTEDLGRFITRNPFIFNEDLDNLEVRVNYLKFKKFDNKMILRIVQDDPTWLSFSTQEIDKRLGFFQKHFSLTGNEVRQLTAKKPRLITYNLEHIKLNTFVIKEEMGFTPEELKQILLHTPKLLMKNQHRILKTFEYIHKEMKIPLEMIVQVPQVLTCREFRIKQRHQFLEKLNKIQFDPKKPNYISLLDIVAGSDSHFATEVAGSTVQAFNTFLKTL